MNIVPLSVSLRSYEMGLMLARIFSQNNLVKRLYYMLSANTVLFAIIVAVTKPLEFKFIHGFLNSPVHPRSYSREWPLPLGLGNQRA